MNFEQLATDICNRFLQEDPQRIIAGGSVQIDGVEAALHWDPENKPEQFTLLVDFGAPDTAVADVHAALLKRNFDLIGHDAGMLALDPQTQNVVFARTFLLKAAGALGTIDALMGAVEEARTWRLGVYA